LARRIEHFLKGVERARRQPNRREAFHIRDALERLEVGQCSESGEAMLRAERCAPLPPHVSTLVATNAQVTVGQLQKQLAEIMKDDA